MILDSSDSLILGDIEVTPTLTRSEAEDVLGHFFHFSDKTSEEIYDYDRSVRVMFLYANIYDQPGRDVSYSFTDFSLFQKYDGSFFLVTSDCAPFAGGQTLRNEFSRDFLISYTKEEVWKQFSEIKTIECSKDFDALFEPREISFYAEQRYLCFDYRVLYYYSKGKAEQLKKDYEQEIAHAEKCIDSEIIKNHLTAEYEKALAAIKNGTWKNLEWEEYRELERQQIVEYKRNRRKQAKPQHKTFNFPKIQNWKIPCNLRKIIASYIACFIGSSIIFCLGSDFDFYLEFGIIWSLIGGVIGTLIIYWRTDIFKD